MFKAKDKVWYEEVWGYWLRGTIIQVVPRSEIRYRLFKWFPYEVSETLYLVDVKGIDDDPQIKLVPEDKLLRRFKP